MDAVETTMSLGRFSAHPWFGVLLFNALIAWPLWRIYRRAGLPPWWSLVAFVPYLGMVLVVALFGHARWPNLPVRPSPRASKPRRQLPTDGG